jgi:hypothetical protein
MSNCHTIKPRAPIFCGLLFVIRTIHDADTLTLHSSPTIRLG